VVNGEKRLRQTDVFLKAVFLGRIRASPWSAAVSKTSRSSFAKSAGWNTPDAVELFHVPRLL